MAEVTQGWEAFCDRSYFDMWCVRKVGDRAFGQGFHVMTQGEAEALRELLTTAQAQASAQEQRIAELEAEVERLLETYEPVASKLTTSFMTDHHSFIPLTGTAEEMAEKAARLIEDTYYETDDPRVKNITVGSYGMLCPIVVSSRLKELRRVGPAVHARAGGPEGAAKFRADAQAWIDAAKADPDVVRLLAARAALGEQQ